MGSIFQEACIGLDYVELPDLSLPALQKRFTIPSELEELYKRYEQRFQVGKSVSPLPPQLRISLVFHVETQWLPACPGLAGSERAAEAGSN